MAIPAASNPRATPNTAIGPPPPSTSAATSLIAANRNAGGGSARSGSEANLVWRGIGDRGRAPAAAHAAAGGARRGGDGSGEKLAGKHPTGTEHHHCQRRDQHGRQLFRIGGNVRDRGARNHAGVGGRRIDGVARGRFAVVGEIGFEQFASDFASRSSARSCTSCADASADLLLIRSRLTVAFDAGVAMLARRFRWNVTSMFALTANLGVESIDLRLELLDPWMHSVSVDDCSASCARKATRCSASRRMSSELRSRRFERALPALSISRIAWPRDARPPSRARGGELRGHSPSAARRASYRSGR